MKRKDSKSRFTLQQQCLGFVNKIESKVRALRVQVQKGSFGTGNSMDIDKFRAAMDKLEEVGIEVELLE